MLSRKAVRRAAALVALLLPGCSTCPLVDLLDYFKPGRVSGEGPPYGGVCLPQGAQVIAPQPAPAPPPAPPPQPPAPPAPPGPDLGPPVIPPGPAAPVPKTQPF